MNFLLSEKAGEKNLAPIVSVSSQSKRPAIYLATDRLFIAFLLRIGTHFSTLSISNIA
jgi:hypothetical protein